MEDLTLVNALLSLLTDAFEKLKASLQNTSCFIDELIDTLMGIVIQKFELLPIFR